MRLHGATKPLLCMAFITSLRNAAKDWFNSLPHGYISSYKDFAYAFYNKFAVSKKRDEFCLIVVHLTEDGKLRGFTQCFNTKARRGRLQ